MITSLLERMRPGRPHMAVLVAMLACTFILTGVLFYQGYVATRGEHEQAEATLLGAASGSAGVWNENLQRNLANGLVYVFEPLKLVGTSALRAMSPQSLTERADLAPLCARCDAMDIYRGSFIHDFERPEMRFTGTPLSPEASQLVLDRVARLAGVRTGGWLIGVVAAAETLPGAAILYAARLDSTDTPEAVIGFHLASGALESYLTTTWANARFMPNGGDFPGDSLFAIRVTDGEGAVWFQSRDPLPEPYSATEAGPRMIPGFAATMAVLPGAEAKILDAMPPSRLPTLLALMVLTTGLLVMSMLLIRRESEITRLRTNFVAGVSHELRTPVAQIRMFTETLVYHRVRTDGERQRALEIIDQEAKRLAHLVENVLLFSRSERGAAQVNREPVDVAADALDAIHGFAILSRSRAVEIRPELQEGIILDADRGALRQILLNLLDNAVKYGPLGQRVTVSLALFEGDVRLWVDDQGPGVPTEHRTRVFESFYRLERDAASTVTGSGIGLAIVRELVTLHGGRVWIDDAPGGGARVVVELPGTYLRSEAKPGEWAVA